jgi:hypothetical protein
MATMRNNQARVPSGEGQQRECARGGWCSASTRDTEGTWRPALTYQPFCPACTSRVTACAAEFPPLYALLAAGPAGLARPAGRRSRIPPGPRIPLSTAADALAREASAVLGGWAARVRAVPGLSLTAPRHPLRSPQRVREDCRVLALHPGPLLALPGGWTSRAYDLPAGGRPALLDRAAATCRRCGRAVTRSRASGWWWSFDGRPAGFCDHDPGPVTLPAPPGPVPGDLEADIGEQEIVRAGDGWVTVMSLRGGEHAGTEILDLHWHARRLTGQVPARPELLDGVPCRSCEAMSALALAEQPPPDPEKPPPPFARCTECRDEMTRAEYDAWAVMYAAWTRGAGILTCRRCDLNLHERCCWAGCTCCGARRLRAA